MAIAACDPRGVVGAGGHLPWDEPDDLEHFRRTTAGHVMICGRVTYDGLPERLWAGRKGVVLSRTMADHAVHPAVCVARTPQGALDKARALAPVEAGAGIPPVWLIGGVQVWRTFFALGLVDAVLLTRLHRAYPGDCFFPLEALSGWSSAVVREHPRFVITRWTLEPGPS